MPILIFDKCCVCCIDLKTGCFIIGYLNLVVTLILTVFTAIAVITGAVFANDGNKEHYFPGLAVAVIAGVVLVFIVLGLAFAIVLLIGLHKNDSDYLRAYLIYTVVFLVVSTINFIAKCATGIVDVGFLVLNVFSIILEIYFFLVIRSMFFHMRDPSPNSRLSVFSRELAVEESAA